MLTVKPPKTLSDVDRLPPETRAELIEGEIYMSPSPSAGHQAAAGRVYRFLADHVESRRLGRVFIAPLDVVLGDELAQPDVLFVSAARAEIVGDKIEGAPDLVVEVLSPGSEVRDRVVKRDLYACHGVREYWIVDRGAWTIEVWKLVGGAYVLHAVFERGDLVTSTVLDGLRLPVDAVFAA